MEYADNNQETTQANMASNAPTPDPEYQQEQQAVAESSSPPSASPPGAEYFSTTANGMYPPSSSSVSAQPLSHTGGFGSQAMMYGGPQMVATQGGYMGSPAVNGQQYYTAPGPYSPNSPMGMGGMNGYGGMNSNAQVYGGSYPAGSLSVPQFIAPQYTSYTLPGGAPVNYLPPVVKKSDGKKKRRGVCC